MLPGDRLICIFTKNKALGHTFSSWYLHSTIVPWFRLPLATQELSRQLAEAIKDCKLFEIVINGETQFGYRSRKTVSLIAEPTPLTDLEQKSRALLKAHNAWLVDETTKQHHGFRPHITVQQNARLKAGDSFWCDKVYIVEQKGSHKEIVAAIPLQS